VNFTVKFKQEGDDMDKGFAVVTVHANGVKMTFSPNLSRVPIVGEYIWLNHKEDSGVYMIKKVVHTPNVVYNQDAWIQVEPVELGLQHECIDSQEVNDTLDSIFETKKA
jgi:hypothetical protein